MTTVASTQVPEANIKIRWKEPFLSEGLNQKALATNVRGLYRGLVPAVVSTTSFQLNPGSDATGSVTSFNAAAGSFQVLTDTSGPFHKEAVGLLITVTGAAAQNNGTFQVTQYFSANSIGISNAGGISETPGSATWTLFDSTNDSIAVVEDPDDGFTTTVRYTAADAPLVDMSGVTFPLQSNALGRSGTGDTLSAATADGYQTLDDAGADWTSGDIGRYITIASASSGNNGTFLIVDVPSGQQLTIYNPSGQSETSSFTWSVAQRFWLLLDVDYRRGVDTSAQFLLVDDPVDLSSNRNAIRILRMVVPTGAADLNDVGIVFEQVGIADAPDPEITTRPFGDHNTIGFSSPGRRTTEMVRQDFSGLGAVTQVTLTGTFYVGRGATGTANRYFAFAEQVAAASSEERQLVGSNLGAITVNRVINPSTSLELDPSGDSAVDSEGFIDDPIIEADFSAATETNFNTINPRVLGLMSKRIGLAVPDDYAQEPVRGFFEALTDNTAGYGFTVGPTGSGADFEGADDTPFQAAHDALPSTGGRILVLPGTYTFTAVVSVTTDNVVFEGLPHGGYSENAGASSGQNTTRLVLGNSFRGTASSGGLFDVDAHNVTFRDLVFEDTGTVAFVYDSLVYYNYSTATNDVEGPKFYRCAFASNDGAATGAGRLLRVGGGGGGGIDAINNVVVQECLFESSNAQNTIDIVEVSELYFKNNRAGFASGSTDAYFLNIDTTTTVGRVHTVIENNKVEIELSGSSAGFLNINSTGAATENEVYEVRGNTFITDSTDANNASGLLQFSIGTPNDVDSSRLLFENNRVYAQAVTSTGGVLFFMDAADQPGTLLISGNDLLASDTTISFSNLGSAGGVAGEDGGVRLTQNKVQGLAAPWFDNTAANGAMISDNIIEYNGDTGSTDPTFPSSATITGNKIARNRTVAGTNDCTLILSSNVVFADNYLNFTTNINAGDSIIEVNADTRVTIKGNTIFGDTGLNLTAIATTLLSATSDYTNISGNHFKFLSRGIFSAGSTVVDHWVVDSNIFEDVGQAVSLVAGDQLVVANNIVDFSNSTDQTGTIGILVNDDCVVQGNILRNWTATAADTSARQIISVGSSCIVNNNLLHTLSAASRGIVTGQNVLCVGNRMITLGNNNSQVAVIGVDAAGQSVISSNYFSGIGSAGGSGNTAIETSTGDSCINGNFIVSILGSGSIGIELNSGGSNTVSANNITAADGVSGNDVSDEFDGDNIGHP